jgi:outer membrane receptor for ferrienterochelin and colicin
LTPNLSATLNLFDIHTKDTITYSYDAERGDTYGNYGDTGSRGLEAQMNYLDKIVSASLSYSFYRANNKNDYFAVLKPDGTPLTKNFLLATPAHKIVLQESTKLTENVQWTTSLSWYGKKYGYTGLAEDGETPYAESMDPVTLVNSNVLFKNVIGQWFDVQLGVNNVFNNRMFYAQPYNGYHAPLPGLSREGYITLIGRF